MTTFFISDLHLEAGRPAITAIFFRFLQNQARNARALYILGDLFEAWIGDDDDAPLAIDVQKELRALTDRGVPCYFMHGNRDFLVGAEFSQSTGVSLLHDPTVIDLYGEPVLLMHGDTLCTDDVAYQTVRKQLRDATWQAEFLAQPLPARRAFAEHAREQSRLHTSSAAMDIMDVWPVAVREAFHDHRVRTLIHGHTHRPALHRTRSGSIEHCRYVLSDWHTAGSCLVASNTGIATATC